MAITRRWQAGMDCQNTTEFHYVSGSPVASTTVFNTGTHSFRVDGSQSNHYGLVNVPATRQLRIGFFYYCFQGSGANEANFLWVVDASGNELVAVERHPAIFTSVLEIAGANQDSENFTLYPARWYHIGVDLKIDSSAGWVKVYIDGVETLSFSGNTGNADIIGVRFGTGATSQGSSVLFYYDDMFIDDSTGEGSAAIVPAKRFRLLTLSGNGNYNGNWNGSDGNSVDNYALVDELPPSATDYLTENVADTLESFAMSTYTLILGETCIAVIPQAYAYRGGLTELIAVGTRENATDAVSSDKTPGASPGLIWDRQTTSPDAGFWDQSAIDGVEVVLKARGTY